MLNNETGGLHSYFVTDIQSDEKKKKRMWWYARAGVLRSRHTSAHLTSVNVPLSWRKTLFLFFYFLKLYCIRQGLRIFIEIEWLWDAVSPYLRCVHSLFFEKHSTPYKIRGWVFCFLLPARPTEKCRRNVRGCNAHRYFFTMKRLTAMIGEYPLRCCFSFDARVFCFIFAYAPTYINMKFKRVIN